MDVTLVAHLALRIVEFPALFVALVVLWLLIIGGSIGSFLNVVVYRMPQGLSLVRPGSHCPRCGTPILARDNLPVVGWLKLRGRCRACRCWISPRYPLVELVTALIFLGLALVEPLGAGENLPIPHGPGAENLFPLWGMLAYHFVLMCGLLSAALIAYDGEAVPARLWGVVWLIGIGAAFAWPKLRPVGLHDLDNGFGWLVVGLLGGLAGTAVGVALGAASWPASTVVARGRSGNTAGVAGAAVVGAFLGWQAASVVVFAAGALWAGWQLVRFVGSLRFDLPWLAFLTATTLVWLFAWRTVVDAWPNLGSKAPWYLPPVATLATLLIALAGRTLADTLRRRTS
jgi:leader peptidase (prepilin peptidase)/N-methyltransferase